MDNKYYKILLDYDKHCRRIASATTIKINESAKERQKRIGWLEKDYIRWFEYHSRTMPNANAHGFTANSQKS